jgi:integrase
MFHWAMRAGIAEANPAAFTNKEGERTRSRVLSAGELREIWTALPEGDYGSIIRLLILTGQRRTEIGDLRWSEIDLKRCIISLPPERTKNTRRHVIPMPEAVRSIVRATPKTEGRDFVFGYGNGGFSSWSRCKRRLDATINARRKMEPWTIHDLRRTAATMMADDLGIQPHVIEATLNHASGHKGGIAGIYNRARYEKEMQSALTAWAKRVAEIVRENADRKAGRAS